ncbi:HPP family protein [Massilia sp. CT11-108]|uniref:HPP family protein n=1 Tax=Massilia sp. CT11-108 TaxID=3393900 RepID=UPI0039A6DD2D
MILPRLTHFFYSFLPSSNQIGARERLRSCFGALIGILITGAVTSLALGHSSSDLPLLVAPMGASAVLLFGMPASPLAQPWSLVGGNLIAALLGVTCARWIDMPLAASALAVGLSIALMFPLRCFHPPSGAVALTAVLGGPAIHALGYRFAVLPIGLNSLVLLASAIVYHRMTGHRYPHRARARRAPTNDEKAPFTRADLEAVLMARNEMLDIDVGDLEAVLGDVEVRAYRRRMDKLDCARVMTTGVLAVAPTVSVSSAWAILVHHKIKALPVLDDERSVVGIVTQMDFIRHGALPPFMDNTDARQVGDIMSVPVKTVRASQLVADLVPMFASFGHHHLPVIDAAGKFAGMITQANLVRGLHQQPISDVDPPRPAAPIAMPVEHPA